MFASLCKSQTPIFVNFTVDDGLAGSTVFDLHQDKKGFLWIATDRGLCVYDGYGFRHFGAQQGLRDPAVMKLAEAPDGGMVLITLSGQVYVIRQDTLRPHQNSRDFEAISDNTRQARYMWAGRGSQLKVGYLKGGLAQVDEHGRFSLEGYEANGNVVEFRVTQSDNGLAYYSSRPHRWPHKLLINGKPVGPLLPYLKNGTYNILALRRKRGDLVAYLSECVFEENQASGDFTLTPLPGIHNALFEDSDSCLYIAETRGGVKRFGPNQSISSGGHETWLKGYTVSSIIEDQDGGIWMGTIGKGLIWFPSPKVRLAGGSTSTSDYDVTAICGDGTGRIFAASQDGRVLMAEHSSSGRVILTESRIPQCSYLPDLVFDRESQTLIAAGGDMAKNPPKTLFGFGLFASQGYKRTLGMDPARHRVWMVSHAELYYYDVRAKTISDRKWEFNERLECVFVDSHGRIWLGSKKGLWLFHNDHLIHLGPLHPLLSAPVQDILELPDGTLALATLGRGVVIASERKVVALDLGKDSQRNIVNCLAHDGRCLWAGSQNGLLHICTGPGALHQVGKHIIASGLPSQEIKSIFVSQDTLWVGTSHGLSYFATSLLAEDADQLAPRLVGIRVNDQPVALPPDGQALHLAHHQNLVRIDYHAISLRMKGNIRYHCRLLGVDSAWHETRVTSLQYFSLGTGDYVFEVVAENEDGEWGLPARLAFTLHPPFWQRGWFIILCLLFTAGLIGLLVRLRIRAIRKRHDILQQIAGFRQQALSLQMNPHFLFNTLNAIQGIMLGGDRKKTIRSIAQFSTVMRQILNHSGREWISIAEEVIALRGYTEVARLRFGEERFEFDVDCRPEASLNLRIPPLLVQPLLENAIVHGLLNKHDGCGKVQVSFSLEEGRLWCRVEDNGIGRAASALLRQEGGSQHTGSGTAITVQRLRLLCERHRQPFHFDMQDLLDSHGGPAGTRVTFSIPHQSEETT